jgi:hypothetical protein
MPIPFPAEYKVSCILLQFKRQHVKIREDLQFQWERGKLHLPQTCIWWNFGDYVHKLSGHLSSLAFSHVYFLSPRIILIQKHTAERNTSQISQSIRSILTFPPIYAYLFMRSLHFRISDQTLACISQKVHYNAYHKKKSSVEFKKSIK